MIECSWNNSLRFLLVWRMFQFLRTTAGKYVKIDYILISMECVLDLVVLDLFLLIDCFLQAYQLFLIAYEQVSDRYLATKIFLLLLFIDCQNLSKLSRFCLFEVVSCIELHEQPHFLFPNVLKRWSFQKSRTGI